jgi:plastocyanin
MILGTCVAGALLGLTGCGSGSDGSSSAPKAVTLNAYDNYYTPATITAQAGKKVTLQFKNEGTAEHNFSVKELGVDQDVPAGKSTMVSFTPGSAGTLPFFCKYHNAVGMTGTVNVSS